MGNGRRGGRLNPKHWYLFVHLHSHNPEDTKLHSHLQQNLSTSGLRVCIIYLYNVCVSKWKS